MRRLVFAFALAGAALTPLATWAERDTTAELLGGEIGFEVPGARVVAAELDLAGHAFGVWGFAPLDEDVIALVPVGETGHRETYRLEGGRDYLFQAACDRACVDVDLALLGADGAALLDDRGGAGGAMVAFTPARSGRYIVHVWLTRCSADPCYVGVRVYGRQN